MANEQKIIEELVCSPDDSLHKVIRSFYLQVVAGPLTPVPVGSIVRLKPETSLETFYGGKTEPVELPSTFKVLRPIQMVGEDGNWVKASEGDLVKLDKTEALEFLRKGMVKGE